MSFYAFLDFGVINWVSITKNKLNSILIFKRVGLCASLSVSCLFTLFVALSVGSYIDKSLLLLIFIDVFLNYLVLANVIILAKQEKYLVGILVHLISNVGLMIYLTCMLLNSIHIELTHVVIMTIVSKLFALCLVWRNVIQIGTKPAVKKFLIYAKYCRRFLIIQVSSFLQYGSDVFLAYHLFDLSDFNRFSAVYRIMASSLVVAGFVTAYMINYSSSFKNKLMGSIWILPAFFIQCAFLLGLANVVNVDVTTSMLVYVCLLFYLSVKSTESQIVSGRSFALYFAIIAGPVFIVKLFSLKYFGLDGLTIAAALQATAFLVYKKFFVGRIQK